tara:strand:- start:117 stop:746 length:630 start_codon:yes stop_codon:yes gene_type:complete
MKKMKKTGNYIILSSPSGAGKTTLAKKLIKKNKNIELSVSYTTRKKRPNETDKKDYHFISEREFTNLKKKKFFIEWARVFNNYYGTSLKKVKQLNKIGKDILFDIDWQGSRKIKKKLGNKVISIFILPPSKKELIKRLKNRAQDSTNIVNERLSSFNSELSHWKEYEHVLINDNLQLATKQISSIIKEKKTKVLSKNYLIKFITSLKKN